MSELIRINKYLAAEYGYFDDDGEVCDATDTYPFQLEYIGQINSRLTGELRFYSFGNKSDGLAFVNERIVGATAREGLSIQNLQAVWTGQEWLESEKAPQHPFTVQSAEVVPQAAAQQFLALLDGVRNESNVREIKAAAYIARLATYAWVGTDETGIIVGVRDGTRRVPFKSRNSWRELSYGVGQLVENGIL